MDEKRHPKQKEQKDNSSYKLDCFVYGKRDTANALIRNFMGKTYSEEYTGSQASHLGVDLRKHTIDAGGETCTFNIWTRFEEKESKILHANTKENYPVIFTIDVTSSDDFDDMKRRLHITQNDERNHYGHVTKYIAAVNTEDESKRVVSKKEIEDFAKVCDIFLLDVNPKEGTNVNELFRVVAKDFIARKNYTQILCGIEEHTHGKLKYKTMEENLKTLITKDGNWQSSVTWKNLITEDKIIRMLKSSASSETIEKYNGADAIFNEGLKCASNQKQSGKENCIIS
jgi:hypothetical protein